MLLNKKETEAIRKRLLKVSTLAEVARRCNCSKMWVSLVLRHPFKYQDNIRIFETAIDIIAEDRKKSHEMYKKFKKLCV